MGSSDISLDELDARAEIVTAELGTTSESEYEDDGGDSDSDYEEPAAGVTAKPDLSRQQGRKNSATVAWSAGSGAAGGAAGGSLPLLNAEDDAVLRAASWQDLESERRFLQQTHQQSLESIIEKFENEAEDGDIVDLNTGRIVSDVGHLRALAPRPGLLEADSSSQSEDDVEEQVDNDESLQQTVCQQPLLYLERAVLVGLGRAT